MAEPAFFLGETIDPKTGKRSGEKVEYPSDHLVTHGVIVGMTGSGKTGLGTIFLEEALSKGLPALIIDPKGDMTNLALTFPDVAPADFAPWVDAPDAGRDKAAAEAATAAAAGLKDWGLSGKDIATLRSRAGFTVYTPGSTAGIPLDVLGSLAAPPAGTDAETRRDEVEGLTSGLLSLVGVESDPVSGREHILVATLVERAWDQGENLTLENLIARVHRPPIRKLGVFEIDTFFPEKDRLALAMRINTLLASPSFQAWRTGPPLDVAKLLWAGGKPDGKPQAAILYLAHLTDAERQFVVTLTLSRLITWMRAQSGTDELRLICYMDEVFGFVPPTAMPPAKKPILTLMKTARAFGVGMLLATQNPVDLDYKAMSNAGTWCIGRLQTERDKARILEGLQSASGVTDIKAIDAMVSGLAKRQFVLHDVKAKGPVVFTTRWAMSYLRGPLTRDQVAKLVGEDPRRALSAPSPAAPPDPDATPVAPSTAGAIPARHIDPGAQWLTQVGAKPNSTRFAAAVAVRVRLRYDDAKSGVDHSQEWEAVFHPLRNPFDPTVGVAVDHDPRDFTDQAPDGATYLLPEAPVDSKSWFAGVESAVRDAVVAQRRITVWRNPALKLYSRVGEDQAAFLERCRAAADAAADADIVELKRKFQSRIDRARTAINDAHLDVREAQLDAETRRQEEMVSGAGTLIGVLTGRRNSRSLSGAASKRSMTRRAEQRAKSAESKAAAKQESLEALEADMTSAVTEVTSAWQAKAEEVETVEIGLEKTDVTVEPPVLIWVPV